MLILVVGGMMLIVIMQSYSGLRGAVAFSLALLRFTDLAEGSGREATPNECLLREQQVTAILALTIFTVFVQVSDMSGMLGQS